MDLQEINEKQKDNRIDISEVIGIGIGEKEDLSEDGVTVVIHPEKITGKITLND